MKYNYGSIDLEMTLDHRRRATQAIIEADVEDERRRLILSPPPPPARPPARPRNQRIGLGGAVFRARDRQINFDARGRPERVERMEQTVDRALERRERARAERELQDMQERGREGRARLGTETRQMDRANGPPRQQLVDEPVNRRDLGRLADRPWLAGLVGDGVAEAYRRFARWGDGGMWGGLGGLGRFGRGDVAFGGGGAGDLGGMAGPAGDLGGENDVAGIIKKVRPFTYPPPPEGFTGDFDVQSSPPAITVDEDGQVVQTRSNRPEAQPHLCCVYCTEPLLVSSAYDGLHDRVWALRCGHLIHQSCLDKISRPQLGHDGEEIIRDGGGWEVLGADGGGRKRPKRQKTQRAQTGKKPEVYGWNCPVVGCGRAHRSEKGREGEWSQREQDGALAVYM